MKIFFKYTLVGFVLIFLNSNYIQAEDGGSSNPLSGDEEAISLGKTIYRGKCAYCHGLRANGKGRGLPKSADLRKYKRGYTAYVATVVNGYKRMPAWGGMGELEYEQINQVGAYLESLAIEGANWKDEEE
tara:strand:- start:228 stop:617 length:390 start_codon:yes stop_codon:yes gene_type:complete